MVTQEQERIAKIVLDAAFEVHSCLGPGLLESAYQTCLLGELNGRGVFVESEKPLPITYKGMYIDCAYRMDMLVERDKLLIENKSVKEITDIHVAQILSYLRLSGISLGFLFNFNVRSFKDGIHRVVLNDGVVRKEFTAKSNKSKTEEKKETNQMGLGPEARLKAWQDEQSRLQGALREERQKRDREIAQTLKALGDPVEKIAQVTGLPPAEIINL
jgi:GxxExxY protein